MIALSSSWMLLCVNGVVIIALAKRCCAATKITQMRTRRMALCKIQTKSWLFCWDIYGPKRKTMRVRENKKTTILLRIRTCCMWLPNRVDNRIILHGSRHIMYTTRFWLCGALVISASFAYVCHLCVCSTPIHRSLDSHLVVLPEQSTNRTNRGTARKIYTRIRTQNTQTLYRVLGENERGRRKKCGQFWSWLDDCVNGVFLMCILFGASFVGRSSKTKH